MIKRIPLLLTLILIVAACDNPQITVIPTQGSASSTPTISSALPTQTNQPEVPACAPILYGEPIELLKVPSQTQPFDLRSADFNGDGLMDIVHEKGIFATPQDFELEILLNDGNGGLILATSDIFVNEVPTTQHPNRTVLADFNGDCITDIFIADLGEDLGDGPGHQNILVLSAPDGKLVNATANLPQQSDFSHSAAAADIDNDGDLDLFIGNMGGQSGIPPQIWLNDGDGNFSIPVGRLPLALADFEQGNYTACAFADVNSDSFPDLILGANETTNNSIVLLNNGCGYFSLLPGSIPQKPFHSENIAVYITPAYVDGDDYQDLIVTYSIGWYVGKYFQILINNADGTFRDDTDERLPQEDNIEPWLNEVLLYDLDKDGDLDLTTRTHREKPYTYRHPYYLNDGHGYYNQPDQLISFDGPSTKFYTLIDMDGDGGLDGIAIGLDDVYYLVRDLGCPSAPQPVEACTPNVKPPPSPTTCEAPPVEDYIVYSDDVAPGWSFDPWSGTANLSSLASVYQGENAMEVTLEPGGAITFDNWSFDTSSYDYMVFYLNGGATADQELYIEMKSGNNVSFGRAYLPDYIEDYPLQHGEWHLVMVPLNILNPEAKPFAWFDFGDASGNGAATFYIDEIRFVSSVP
ncbi:MAG: VCBS repeat-containing protein [Anaerolineales bacterium]|nr:VCBS repeat-containing protein [Chloroflexota bacterium]MBL6979560.1 VCBS repeat-containing protein [Anaerolineales bacterium]